MRSGLSTDVGYPLVPDRAAAGLSRPAAQAFEHARRLFRPSLDGGLLLLELFLSSWRCNSATCCCSAAFPLQRVAFSLEERGVVFAQSVDITLQRANQFGQDQGIVHPDLDL
jgi:hypothetical protein